ncbi:MAG: hypothetical protein EZS28_013786 [Streblomastix strix]|uniref:Uncharacterized protein n=1 Tax=Streblomastix strix TaxID=222440 RepID=A0A5J4W6X9_9EUKA|nr:MAG: hypothetical protein EZS28_013786 [Streblomastix strix]
MNIKKTRTQFFANAAYISHSTLTVPIEGQNLEQLESIHRAIDGDFNQDQPATAIDSAQWKIIQQLSKRFLDELDKLKSGDVEDRNEQARVKDFTWNISAQQRLLHIKGAAEVMDIELPKQLKDFKVTNDVNQVEKYLLQAQSKANIEIALDQVTAQQHLERRDEPECIETRLATSAEVSAGISAVKRANLYGFKAYSENIHFLTKQSFDAVARVKQVLPIKLKLFQAKSLRKPSLKSESFKT